MNTHISQIKNNLAIIYYRQFVSISTFQPELTNEIINAAVFLAKERGSVYNCSNDLGGVQKCTPFGRQ